MENWNKYELDARTTVDFLREIEQLSKSYTPEWNFTEHNPDAGSVISLIFANQMGENVKKFNTVLENYWVEFINMYGIALLPSNPASAVVVMEVVKDTRQGIDIRKGTRFLAAIEAKGSPVIFTSTHDLHVTDAKIASMLAISERRGKVIHLPSFPIRLFDYSLPGTYKNMLYIYHSYLFDNCSGQIALLFEGLYSSRELATLIADRSLYQFFYETKEGLTEPVVVKREEDQVVLQWDLEQKGKPRALVLQQCSLAAKSLALTAIRLSSSASDIKPHFIHNGNLDLELEQVCIFGEELSEYSECFLGQDHVFAQKGARITIEFSLELKEKELRISMPTPETLNIIKKRRVNQEVVADSYINEVSLSYYNGKGFKKLDCITDIGRMFATKERQGMCNIEFYCPADWAAMSVGGYVERCLRFQIVKADNCYIRPGRHHYPVLHHIFFSYTYDGRGTSPECIVKVQGEMKTDITLELGQKHAVEVFSMFPYTGDAMLFGLDKKPSSSPVSMYMIFQNNVNFRGSEIDTEIRYEYSTEKRFKPLKVIDHTEGLKSSGTLLFFVPPDMAKQSIKGQSCYWIRAAVKPGRKERSYRPMLKALYLNGVEVHNVATMEIEEYYIDEVKPYMSFNVHADNILSANVWVDEKEQLANHQMQVMLQEMPQEVQADYNYMGGIEAFYVKWQEVDSFDYSTLEDRHYLLDRMNKMIHFGDGTTVKIPRSTHHAAFKMSVESCDGTLGNVACNTILMTASNIMFLENIDNPIGAAGGSNLEKIEHARERGSGLLSTRKKLVSENDYVRTVEAFSDTIDKAACITSKSITGRTDLGLLSIVILMKDYAAGSFSFYKLQPRLKEHLICRGEVTYGAQNIEIVEPIFVKVSLEVWLEVNNWNGVIEEKANIITRIRAFLNPLSCEQNNGWDIGSLPEPAQIKRLLNLSRSDVVIQNYSATLSYMDDDGEHHVGLGEIKSSPYMICINGKHQIHIGQASEGKRGKRIVKQPDIR